MPPSAIRTQREQARSDRWRAGRRNLFALYAANPDAADRIVFGRIACPDRRGFLKGAGLATMGALIGASIPFHRTMPAGFVPLAIAEEIAAIEGKDGLAILNELPLNAETPAHLLDDPVTPTARHFVRNNGVPPADADAASWTLTIDGLVETPLTLTIAELRERFEVVTETLCIECAGNGRAFFDPPVSGNPWTYGAVGCSAWTGVRLADVLKAARPAPNAVYTGHYGADTPVSGDTTKTVISRGVPIAKAMDPHNLVAFEQNGAPIHPMQGAPLRLAIPGWPGSCSQKWLTRIAVRDVVHDGAQMTGTAYKLPERPVAPGEKIAERDFGIIEAMPVKSLITHPASGLTHTDRAIALRGHAWVGDDTVAAVDLSVDFGATWIATELDPPANPQAWQHWRATVEFPGDGYYEVWARATGKAGVGQPFAVAWNPNGYANNAMHRISLRIAS